MKDRNLTKVELLVASIAGVFLLIAIFYCHDRLLYRKHAILCRAKLKEIGTLLKLYANDHEGKYPTPERWCDILLEKYAEGKKEMFLCPWHSQTGNYALNSNCTANSPKDVVLVFECIGGWNAFGGPEIQSFTNHKYEGGCNVLFNSGKVRNVGPRDELKWGTEEAGGEQKSGEKIDVLIKIGIFATFVIFAFCYVAYQKRAGVKSENKKENEMSSETSEGKE